MSYTTLIINPGSTSTKVAVYRDETVLLCENISYSPKALEQFDTIAQQYDMRRATIIGLIEERGFQLSDFSAVIGRGGLLPPVNAGGYRVNRSMVERLTHKPAMQHASNLGAMIAYSIAEPLGIPAYIYDAVTSDEFHPIARVTGMPEVVRNSFCHVLNSKAIARKYAETVGKPYEDLNLVMVHLGGGISVSAHCKGRIIDSTSDDFGCFAPERSGSIPATSLIELCYSGAYTKAQMLKKVRGGGGLKALLGTHDCREVEERIAQGDDRAKEVYEAMAYQISKSIAEMSVASGSPIDAIVMTGGVANSKLLTGLIAQRVSFIAAVKIIPGENEMQSLALGGLRILKGEEPWQEYTDSEF